MLIDGEKWACEACVRGHRVSSCRHNDRPLIRINKKGRPFSVCCICRGPCKAREEHSKLNRDAKKSDGESDSKSSGKKPRRRLRPAEFARIAPHPAPLPSASYQPQQQSPVTTTTTAAAAPTQATASPFPVAGSYMPASALAPLDLGYPYVTLPIMEEPLLQPSSAGYPFSDDLMFSSLSDGSSGYVPESMYIGFEDVDALPEDWSTFLLDE